MTENASQEKWQVRMIRPGVPGLDRLPELGLPDISRLPWMNRAIRPADIGGTLRDVMLTRENMLEDVNYVKVVPNRFIVEVSEANYARQFQPIERQIVLQWRERLLEDLVTANSRQGRKEFRFGGRLILEVRPAKDLKDTEARVLSRVQPDASRAARPVGGAVTGGGPDPRKTSNRPQVEAPAKEIPMPQVSLPSQAVPRAAPPLKPAVPPSTRPKPPAGAGEALGKAISSQAYLELVPTGQRWSLYPGINTIGRSEGSQIYLGIPVVLEKRLVSGQHAYIVMEGGACTLYDGSPDGKPSSNGTYVNLRRVPPAGYRLQNGDAIVLAALDPLYPRSDTPGVVTFYFWTEARG
jgi:hypothetical protein